MPSSLHKTPNNAIVTGSGGRRIPGPAGRSRIVHPSQSPLESPAEAREWQTIQWQTALQTLLNCQDFDESHPLLGNGNTIKAVLNLKQSALIERLLVYITSIQYAHNGEALVRLKDPTGTITGTFTLSVMEQFSNELGRGSVLGLQSVSMLRIPPPHAINHLCISSQNIAHVIPRGGGDGLGLNDVHQQQQQRREGLHVYRVGEAVNQCEKKNASVDIRGEENEREIGKSDDVDDTHVDDLLAGFDDDF